MAELLSRTLTSAWDTTVPREPSPAVKEAIDKMREDFVAIEEQAREYAAMQRARIASIKDPSLRRDLERS